MSDSTLKELWQQVAEKKSCEAKQKELTAQRDTLADCLKKLEKSKLAEQADVDRLEGHSLAAFFYQVIGKMDESWTKNGRKPMQPVSSTMRLSMIFLPLMPTWSRFKIDWHGCPIAKVSIKLLFPKKSKASKSLPTLPHSRLRKAKAALPH